MSQRHLSFIALLAAGALLSGCSGGVSSPSDGANHSPDSNQTFTFSGTLGPVDSIHVELPKPLLDAMGADADNLLVTAVELRGHVSNSCRLAITFCWWLWQREARSFPLIHEQNQKAPCKGGQIIGFAIEYHCPAWSPRGEAQPPISHHRDEDRT